MAILRDAQTGQGIAQGSPLDMVVLADSLGRDNILFDDVGEAFDPDAVLQQAREQHEGLRAVIDNPPNDLQEKDRQDLVETATKNADGIASQLEATPEDVDQATQALERAQKQAENPV